MKIKIDYFKCKECGFGTTLKSEKKEHIMNNIKLVNGMPVDNPHAHVMVNLRDGLS